MHETRPSSFSNTTDKMSGWTGKNNSLKQTGLQLWFVTFVFVCLWHCVLWMLISWVKCPCGSWISPPSQMNRAEWLWSFTHDHLELPRIQVCPCSYSQGLGSIVHMVRLDIHLTSISWIQATLFLRKYSLWPNFSYFIDILTLIQNSSCIHKI